MSSSTKVKARATGVVVWVIPQQENVLEWDIIKEEQVIKLTDKERFICQVKKLDAEKFLLVKQLLMTGKSFSKIKKATGVARTTIIRYKQYYCKESINLINLQTTKKPFETTKKL